MRRRDRTGGRPVRGVAVVVLVPHARQWRETIRLEIEYRSRLPLLLIKTGQRGSALPPDPLRDWEVEPWPTRA